MKVFFSDSYVQAGEEFETTRKSGWIAESLRERPILGVELVAPEPIRIEALYQIHAAEYVNAVRDGSPARLASSQGFSWDRGLWDAVCASTGGAVAAALEALHSGVSGSLSSGLHHAKYEHGAGFCTFNGLVAAAHAALQQSQQEILILDLDAHCGGGTHELLQGVQRVRHIDISTSTYDRYTPNGEDILDVVEDDATYLPLIKQRLNALDAQRFSLCLYNAGMDPHYPSSIDHEVLRQREELVFGWCAQWKLPVAFVLAGGYIGASLSQQELIELHRLTIAAAARTSALW